MTSSAFELPSDAVAIVTIDYVNWRGALSNRRIVPVRIYFGSNEWHPEPQWLLEATDIDKNATRAFALSGIKSWMEKGW